MEHVFAFSYGKPFVGNYTPPECEFTHVTFNLSFVSAGVQFDRLALLYFNDTEIWRTSTAEPTRKGIHWEYTKDMTLYKSLLMRRGKIIMDLGNLVDDTYTGTFNGTLTANYYNRSVRSELIKAKRPTLNSAGSVITQESSMDDPPDLIMPISAMRSGINQGSEFRIPRDNTSTAIILERGAFSRASISISASGDSSEEFWYTNVPSSLADTFGEPLPKYSPFREVQVWLDGVMVGVAWPFPIIFTGGVSPGLWKPIVGISAFDLNEYEVDVSPWLWKICDGAQHVWELRVVGIDEVGGNTQIGSPVGWDWIVTGKLLLWNSDSDSGRTTGSLISHNPDLSSSIGISYSWSLVNSTNETLSFKLSVERELSTLATLEYGNRSIVASFTQSLSFSSESLISERGANQTVYQSTNTTLTSSTTGKKSTFSFPLMVRNDFVFYPNKTFSIVAAIDRGLQMIVGEYDGPESPREKPPISSIDSNAAPQASSLILNTRQNGTSTYFSRGGPGLTTGHTEQVYTWRERGADKSDYSRFVEAEGFRMIRDEKSITATLHPHKQETIYSGALDKNLSSYPEDVCLGRFEQLKLSRLLR